MTSTTAPGDDEPWNSQQEYARRVIGPIVEQMTASVMPDVQAFNRQLARWAAAQLAPMQRDLSQMMLRHQDAVLDSVRSQMQTLATTFLASLKAGLGNLSEAELARLQQLYLTRVPNPGPARAAVLSTPSEDANLPTQFLLRWPDLGIASICLGQFLKMAQGKTLSLDDQLMFLVTAMIFFIVLVRRDVVERGWRPDGGN